jgi:hypothetical protein
MKRILSLTVLLVLPLFYSCSGEPEQEKQVEEVKKPLIEREPEVRQYFEVLDDMIDEYMLIAETFLDNAEKIESGDMGALESLSLIAKMGDSALKIQSLNEEMEKLDEKKTSIEEKLPTEDLQEFLLMYADNTAKFMELAKRIEESKYFDLHALTAE